MLVLSNVMKGYGGWAAVNVGHLEVGPGEIVGLLGANGSGKTTLLKAIVGIGELACGTVLLDGKPLGEQYDRVAFITEEGSYMPGMTPLQYAEFLADFYPRFDHEHFKKLLDYFELPDDRRIRTFSKGQKSKLEIAAGMAKRAKLILMDEPFEGKDQFARRDFLKLMIGQLEGDETVIVTTHLVDEIEHVVDRAVVLVRGYVKGDARIDELREQGVGLADYLARVTDHREKSYG